jgi:hypothetical protein
VPAASIATSCETPTRPTHRARLGHCECGLHRVGRADAFQHGVSATAFGEVHDSLDGLGAWDGDDVGGTPFSGELMPVFVGAAEHDDALGEMGDPERVGDYYNWAIDELMLAANADEHAVLDCLSGDLRAGVGWTRVTRSQRADASTSRVEM